MKKYDVITMGEGLIRATPFTQFTPLESADLFRFELGGAEINVAAALSNIANLETGVITKIPDNAIGKWVEHRMRSHNISTKYVVRDKSNFSRMGTYYFEAGSQPRSSRIVYDRMNSSFSNSSIHDYDIDFSCTQVFHTTGITLALNKNIRDITFELIKEFRKNATLISFDVNYRANLWNEDTARESIEKFLPYIDILFVSGETLKRMFRCKEPIEVILRKWSEEYDIDIIASPQRKTISSTYHQFTSVIYDRNSDKIYTENPYNISVVDRIGSGDAFISGVLIGLLENDFNPRIAMEYGNALAALKCTIPGDIVTGSMQEINRIIMDHNEPSTYENLNR